MIFWKCSTFGNRKSLTQLTERSICRKSNIRTKCWSQVDQHLKQKDRISLWPLACPRTGIVSGKLPNRDKSQFAQESKRSCIPGHVLTYSRDFVWTVLLAMKLQTIFHRSSGSSSLIRLFRVFSAFHSNVCSYLAGMFTRWVIFESHSFNVSVGLCPYLRSRRKW